MSFLSARTQAALAPMGCCVEQEVANSGRNNDIETVRARQAHYIAWCKLNEIADPVGYEPGWERVVAIYAKYVMCGINYVNKDNMRSKTVRGYIEAVNALFELRSFPAPVDFTDKENMGTILVDNLKCEEDVANQRSPLTNEIFVELKKLADESESPNSAESVVFNTTSLGRYTGARAGEYAQKTQTVVEEHKYPSGKKVTKAFLADDFVFYDRQGRRMTVLTRSDLERVGSMRVKWRIQKNRRNGQTLKVPADHDNPDICPVRNALQLVLRKIELQHSLELPLAVFVNAKNEIKYLTANKIREIFRKAARRAHPDWTEEEINKISAHSVRVWACVLLSEAGKDPDFIKNRLRWLGESYRLYLRDTNKINQQHREALAQASKAVMDLLNALPSDVDEDTEMGDWADIIA